LEFQLPVILSLKGVITFMMYQKLNFLFDIYEMGRYTLENWEILKTYFQNGEFSTQTVRIISRNADVNWPPCSCDLTPLD